MTESISSSSSVSIKALSDLKAFLGSGADNSREAYETEQENKTAESRKRSYVTKNALSKLLEYSNNKNAESVRRNSAEEKMQSNDEKTNSLPIDTSAQSNRSPLEIQRPEVKTETKPLQIDTSSLSEATPLTINIPDLEEKPTSYTIPKQKNAILYELRNTMHLKYTAWDIAKRYGISYLQAQEIFFDLNQDENGVVKEFNLPENSTVSYLV